MSASKIIAAGFAVIAVAVAAALPFLVVNGTKMRNAVAAPVEMVEQDDTFTANEAEIARVVRKYLMANPEILREMMTALQAKDADNATAQRAKTFEEHRAAIYNSPRQVVLGNPKGDITIVEFFDYNCGYCRKALQDMNALLESDKNLRVVLKEFPVLGEGSRDAARVAVAVHKQAPEKYLDFHRALLGSNRNNDGNTALAEAQKLGLDMNRLAKDLADPVVDATLEESMALAQLLGIDGTPTYIVADTVIPGALGAKTLQTIITNTRNCGKVACS